MLYKRRAGGRLIHFFTHKTAYHVAELTVARRRTDPADSIGRVCTRNKTQEELPETQESVTNYDIFEYDNFVDTQEVDPTIDYDDNGLGFRV